MKVEGEFWGWKEGSTKDGVSREIGGGGVEQSLRRRKES